MSDIDAQQGAEPETPKIYPCEEPNCSKQYQWSSSLKRHLESAHSIKKAYLCSELDCPEHFPTKEKLLAHKRKNHESTVWFFCDRPSCSKSYKQKGFMERHISIHHGDTKVYHCDKPNCGRSFNREGNLNHHTRRMHERAGQPISTEIYNVLFAEGCKVLAATGTYTCPYKKSTATTRQSIKNHLLFGADSTEPVFVEAHGLIDMKLLNPSLNAQAATSNATLASTDGFAERQTNLKISSAEPITWNDLPQLDGESDLSLSTVTQHAEDDSQLVGKDNCNLHSGTESLTTESFGGEAGRDVNDMSQYLKQDATVGIPEGEACTHVENLSGPDDDMIMNLEYPVQESSGPPAGVNLSTSQPPAGSTVPNPDDDLDIPTGTW